MEKFDADSRRTLRKKRTLQRLQAQAQAQVASEISTSRMRQQEKETETLHAQGKRIDRLSISVPPRNIVSKTKKKMKMQPPPKTLDWNLVLPETQQDSEDPERTSNQKQNPSKEKHSFPTIFSLSSSSLYQETHPLVSVLPGSKEPPFSLENNVDPSTEIQKKKKKNKEPKNQIQNRDRDQNQIKCDASTPTLRLSSISWKSLPKWENFDSSPPLFQPPMHSALRFGKKKVRFQLDTFKNESSSSIPLCLDASSPKTSKNKNKKRRCFVSPGKQESNTNERMNNQKNLILILYKEFCAVTPIFVEEEELLALGVTREFFESRAFRVIFSEKKEILPEKIQLRDFLARKMKEFCQVERCYEKLIVQNRHLLFSCVCSLE